MVKCPKDYFFYEAELMGERKKENPEEYVLKILKSLGLKIWSENQVYDFLMFCNNEIDEHFKLF
ncbi:hypothetical protein COT64_02200 [Candidatus Shapirobacteria bacterium CG09_land_8_20_14_0_10_39_12]|uniref:Uncharacterized protein n=1 Tax=Candidatus Shapirobacteria bacterium CG09_land_8_20_14_0_10_39_12 TaxID=1974885 RepID=A0A2H0WPF8_9BACT|nr:MAG: hypothetical protein COT64_02200 [Candidatus Shapirobacteria bacterium CG09_land_8_20_14_0_10_39_12]